MKCNYRVRWFNSKGAFLVLVWNLLIFCACASTLHSFIDSFNVIYNLAYPKWLFSIPILTWTFFSAALSGWLADTKLGNYKVCKTSIMLLFIHNVINCFLLVLEAFVSENNLPVTEWIRFSVSSMLFAVGGSAWTVTSLPFGLNQIPDASSSSITSFIVWFICSLFIGNCFTNVLKEIKESCFSELNLSFSSYLCLIFNHLYEYCRYICSSD